MAIYHRIMVPTDGSQPSVAALEHALVIARDQGAQLKLVVVLDEGVSDYTAAEIAWVDRGKWHKELLADARKALETGMARLQDAGLEGDSEVIAAPKGGVGEVIVEAAERWQADLLVIGSHGRHGVERLLLGSVSESVVRNGRLPVLVVPAIAPAADPPP